MHSDPATGQTIKSYLPPRFRVSRDDARCIRCQVCENQCSFSAQRYDQEEDRMVAVDRSCAGCHRCEALCPTGAICIEPSPSTYRENANWTAREIRNLNRQAETGGVLLSGMGNDRPYPIYWDHLLLDASQVTNPAIDPLREPMELRTYLGRRPDALEIGADGSLLTRLEPQLALEIPLMFSALSYGAINLNVCRALAMAATACGTYYNTGEGGLHESLYCYSPNTIVQVASGRFGVHLDYLEAAAAIEIKIGQGAKPGVGGHLPGEKVNEAISSTRMIPLGTDALSPAPQHDIYSIEDLRLLIYALKEATRYTKPVSVKIAAVHNVGAIASGIVRAGADIVYLDGFRGGTGAAPTVIRDHLGIPIEIALAVVDQQLREEGIRNQASLIAAGGIRSSADAAKAIALGADAVALGTGALLALGCTLCQKCYTGRCSWGITSQDPALTRRLDPYLGSRRLINLVSAWAAELEEILGAMGVNAVESLRGSRERLRAVGLDRTTMDIMGVKPAGVGA